MGCEAWSRDRERRKRTDEFLNKESRVASRRTRIARFGQHRGTEARVWTRYTVEQLQFSPGVLSIEHNGKVPLVRSFFPQDRERYVRVKASAMGPGSLTEASAHSESCIFGAQSPAVLS